MADVTINNLTGQAPTNNDVFPFSTTGVTPATYKASLTQIKTALAISWSDVSGKPSFATVATTGSYNDLINKPTIPAAVNAQLLPRAWVNFDGYTAGINSQFNVSSITRNGAGDWTVNFASSMPDANYAVFCTGMEFDTGNYGLGAQVWKDSKTINNVRVTWVAGNSHTHYDTSSYSVIIYR